MKCLLTVLGVTALFQTAFCAGLPVVDLGYEVHQASSLNQTTGIYNFSNIRFAQAPVGDLRWAAPVSPTGRNSSVTVGPSPGPICPQAAPLWYIIAESFLNAYINGSVDSFNYSAAAAAAQAYVLSGAATTSGPDPRTSEDCLFLDVFAPQAVFDNAHNRYKRGENQKNGKGGVPVLIWIYGGGYVAGSKTSSGDPTGLIKASQQYGGQGIIFIAMNYRLGALGFMAGSTLQGSGGVANAAFYDQRLAIEWAAKNVHLFGGDPNQITIMGESAGGGSVEHQITAYGGQKGVSFQKAIPQSPAFLPLISAAAQENTTQTFLKLLNVSTIADARKLNSSAVIQANSLQIAYAPYGQYFYGPAVDNTFVPGLPGQLFNDGAFAKNVQIMDGHNTNESPFFTPPFVKTAAQLTAFFKQSIPTISNTALSYLTNVLYPASAYNSTTARVMALIQDSSFTCNNYYINRAYNFNTYSYQFEVPPAVHGQDVPYTFAPPGAVTNLATGFVASVAQALQGYITNFVISGNPNGPGLPPFPMQGRNASMNALNVTGIGPAVDPTVNARCVWWQKALYY